MHAVLTERSWPRVLLCTKRKAVELMNKKRRRSLEEARVMLSRAQEIIEDVRQDEEMAFENLSESLQQTARGQAMESNVDLLSEIGEELEEISERLDEVE